VSRSSSLLATLASVLLLAACAHVRESSAPTINAGPSVAETSAELGRLGVSVRELAPDVFVAVVDSPNQSSANVLFVKARDGSVVICSSAYDTETTRALVRHVRASLHPTRILAINTHFHGDGTGGNEGYAAEGVETYASDHTIALQAARGTAGIEGMARYVESDNPALAARVRATHVVAARHVFHEVEGLTFDLGGEAVRVLFVGGGHSADNLVVHFADRGVLFGGCMVRSHPGLGNTADADLEHWAASAEAALVLAPRLVIPGHGEPGGSELLTTTAAAVRAR
jgi:glyoxylase-like metal-dependent hydrolase (beta-lactamase superfamily II)